MDNITFVTALYNIQREEKGDGRKWKDYLEWFKNTLKMPLKMVIYIPSDLVSFVEEHRPKEYATKIMIQEKEAIPYAKYETAMGAILERPDYRMKMKHPDRVECKIPFYNIIQYSKFKWLEEVATLNPFESDYFFWMDAGISRFVPLELYSRIVSNVELPVKKLVIQCNHMLLSYPVHEGYLWDSQCLLSGGMFGGDQALIHELTPLVDRELENRISQGWINNEQLLLAYLYRTFYKELFFPVYNNTGMDFGLFHMMLIR